LCGFLANSNEDDSCLPNEENLVG